MTTPNRPGNTLAFVGSFSIDSVLMPDGRWAVDKIGGNALWSALGARACGFAPRVLAVVGRDYPAHVLETLAEAGIDTSAVVHLDRNHPVRVTFAHLPDGARIQPVPARMVAALPELVRPSFVDTTGAPEVLEQGAPRGEDIPDRWLDEVDAWHLPLLPLHRHRSVVARISGARGRLHSDCPARSDLLGNPFGRLAPTLPSLDVFLPSTSDFDVIAPRLALAEVVDELRRGGAGTVVVKAGADGAFVCEDQRIVHVPAYARAPVDPTGAGDAFCGGFLAGIALGRNAVEAASLGAAVASFAVATENPLTLARIDPAQTFARAETLLSGAAEIDSLPAPRDSALSPLLPARPPVMNPQNG